MARTFRGQVRVILLDMYEVAPFQVTRAFENSKVNDMLERGKEVEEKPTITAADIADEMEWRYLGG